MGVLALEQFLLGTLRCELGNLDDCPWWEAYVMRRALPRLFKAVPKAEPERGREYFPDWACQSCIDRHGYRIESDPIGEAVSRPD